MMQSSVIPTQINHQSASANNPMASASSASAYTPSCSSPGWNTVEGNKRRKSGKSGKSVQQEPQPLSICIPRAHKTISLQRVRNTFQRLNLGSVDSVDIVSKTSKEGEPFVTIYVHFSNWNYDNPEAVAFREKIIKGEQVSIFYDEPKPWFWKCALNHLPRKLLPSIAPVTAPAAQHVPGYKLPVEERMKKFDEHKFGLCVSCDAGLDEYNDFMRDPVTFTPGLMCHDCIHFYKKGHLPNAAPAAPAVPLSPPRPMPSMPSMSPMSPMSPPHLPRWGTAEYMSLFSIVDTINTKK